MNEALLMSYLRQTCTPEECLQVEAWCEASPENRRALEQIYYTLFVGDRLATMERVDTEESLQRLKQRIRAKQTAPSLAPSIASRPRWRAYRVVAAAFLAGLIVMAALIRLWPAPRLADYTVLTAAGQRAQTLLPDGSRVWLNGKTRLVYRGSSRGGERRVELEGEAYFEVARAVDAPFVVCSKEVQTRVLGTKFNVRAREDEDRVVTTLLQGSVCIDLPRQQGSGRVLKPGQTLEVDTKNYEARLREYHEPADVLLWIKGKLSFRQYSLKQITDLMEKMYDVEFVYDEASLREERFTGDFSTDSTPEEILHILTYTNYFTFQKEGRLIRLSRN